MSPPRWLFKFVGPSKPTKKDPNPYIQTDRVSQVREGTPPQWFTRPFHRLEKGDVFRLLSPEGVVAQEGTPYEVCVALEGPFHTKGPSGKSTWGIGQA